MMELKWFVWCFERKLSSWSVVDLQHGEERSQEANLCTRVERAPPLRPFVKRNLSVVVSSYLR